MSVRPIARVLLGPIIEANLRGRRCAPGEAALAELAHCSTRTVRRAVRELREHGLVAVIRRGRGRNALIRLVRPLWRRLTGRVPRRWPRPLQITLDAVVRRLAAPAAGWEGYTDGLRGPSG